MPVVKDYFYTYGGMKLNPHELSNDNGPLFAATYYALLGSAVTEADKVRWLAMMRSIEIEPGLYSRYPGCTLVEAHDNYIGHILAAEVFQEPRITEAIADYPWYNYNDQAPGKWTWATQRQGGDIALYNLAAGRRPCLALTVWLSVGIGLGNVMNLIWCRVELLRRIWPTLPWLHKKILRYGLAKWFKKFRHAYIDKTIITHYYADKDHPICELARAQPLWHGEWWRN